MKATIERATLLKSLGHVQSVVERRNTIPILSNVLIEAREDGSIRLMATDLDLQVDESVPANVAQPGATTVSAHTLFDIVRKLPEGSQVEIAAAEGKMQVLAGRSRFNLSTLPRDDFPVIAEGDLPTRFELPAATLRQIIEKTRFAISSEETRYYLMGIFFHIVDDQLRAAATDGHRLARITVARPDGADGMPDVIVPRKAVAELYRLLEELEGTVEISLSPTKIRFGLGSAILTSKLIDGTFPDYNRVIPTANDKLLKLDPKSFSAGVDRVSTIASEKTRAVKISLDRDKVTLSVTSPENGIATEELPADYGSDGLEIGFNARYLLDILGEIDGDTVEVHLADAAAPTLLRENDKSNALYVLMPMRV
ncbi:DNA polymerase III subunit beta [Sphingomonas hankyongi]|uniref:Beta sliding clamp n=1 Tax=Sphingomonas hankyongi TaxID=2908209 RepID=A0ABT0S4S3_9SPHN|nr:DNA polymerase III subunit beta [Sphingomonas hankyongi]MCL6730855.1 DNA polymerase III subunit beta [Sphingomonas hankyongi]